MGISIHYRGRINDVAMVITLTDELEDFAQSLGWRTEHWKENLSKPRTARIRHEEGKINITGNIPLQGITLFPHKDCEPLSLTFDRNGYLISVSRTAMVARGKTKRQGVWVSTKTQFAPLETHISIIKLLQHLKKRYIANLEVHDEGGYWESGDVNELKRRFDSINRSLDVLEAALSTVKLDHTKANSPEEFTQMIERILKGKLGR